MTPLAYCALNLAASLFIALVVTNLAPGLAHRVGRRQRRKGR